jgi:hypothetical protein
MRALVVLALAGALLGCPGNQWSTDPDIRAKQEWITKCAVADSSLRILTQLYRARKLSEAGAERIDGAFTLYEAVCAVAPPNPDEPLISTVIQALAVEVCPTIAPSEDWALTAIEAAQCVAAGAAQAATEGES